MLGPSSLETSKEEALGSIRVAWWNLEILFDTRDDPISRGFEYTPGNEWTTKACEAKKANLAAALNELHGGAGPKLLGSQTSKATTPLASSSLLWATRISRS